LGPLFKEKGVLRPGERVPKKVTAHWGKNVARAQGRERKARPKKLWGVINHLGVRKKQRRKKKKKKKKKKRAVKKFKKEN